MHKKLILFFSLIFIMALIACDNRSENIAGKSLSASGHTVIFEPEDGKVILFVGQELESIGGTENYQDGYFDHFPPPGGFTQYTDFLTGFNSFGFMHKGLDGLSTLDDWGDGPENMSVTVNDPDFKNACLAIGLDMSQGNDSVTASGGHDSLIYRLANWIKALEGRPVFLRIGYEFDGFDWNHYRKEFYVPAWKRIHAAFDSMGVNNVAYVWQSKGGGAKRDEMDGFYPGDELVDWVAYSFFTASDAKHPMIQFARDHHKPLFIAESTPVILDSQGVSVHLNLADLEDARKAWKEWFSVYFETIHNNKDVIKAISYINAPWRTRAMWKENNFFKNIDARITKNDSIKLWWNQEISNDRYLKSSDTLFSYLRRQENN